VAVPGIENHYPDNNYSLRYGATGILDFDRDHRHRFLWRIPTWGLGTGQTVEIVEDIAADASDRGLYLTFAGQKRWLLPCAMKPARKKLLEIDFEHGQSTCNGEQSGVGRNREKGSLKVDIVRARTRIETGRHAPRKKPTSKHQKPPIVARSPR
jgi:hypothetical protein